MKPNGMPNGQQPKNTVAMLNELKQGLIYNLESQTGPVHAPIFTMTVEVKNFLCHSLLVNLFSSITIKLHLTIIIK